MHYQFSRAIREEAVIQLYIMEKITGAEALMRSLRHEGVDILFGYPGGAIMPTYDALYD